MSRACAGANETGCDAGRPALCLLTGRFLRWENGIQGPDCLGLYVGEYVSIIERAGPPLYGPPRGSAWAQS